MDGFRGQFVFPDSNHRPSHPAQRSVNQQIPRHVCPDLFLPKDTIALGLPAVDPASVPKTPVDEYGNLPFGENEIWATGDPRSPSPPGDSHHPEQ
jgi:hypothetical protein